MLRVWTTEITEKTLMWVPLIEFSILWFVTGKLSQAVSHLEKSYGQVHTKIRTVLNGRKTHCLAQLFLGIPQSFQNCPKFLTWNRLNWISNDYDTLKFYQRPGLFELLKISADSVRGPDHERNNLTKNWAVLGSDIIYQRLHRCWWRILGTKCVGDTFEMLVTVLVVFVTNILYLLTLASDTRNQKMLTISKFCH